MIPSPDWVKQIGVWVSVAAAIVSGILGPATTWIGENRRIALQEAAQDHQMRMDFVAKLIASESRAEGIDRTYYRRDVLLAFASTLPAGPLRNIAKEGYEDARKLAELYNEVGQTEARRMGLEKAVLDAENGMKAVSEELAQAQAQVESLQGACGKPAPKLLQDIHEGLHQSRNALGSAVELNKCPSDRVRVMVSSARLTLDQAIDACRLAPGNWRSGTWSGPPGSGMTCGCAQ